mgnify:FL=1
MSDNSYNWSVNETDSSENGLGVQANAGVTHDFSNGDSLTAGVDGGYNQGEGAFVGAGLTFNF